MNPFKPRKVTTTTRLTLEIIKEETFGPPSSRPFHAAPVIDCPGETVSESVLPLAPKKRAPLRLLRRVV